MVQSLLNDQKRLVLVFGPDWFKYQFNTWWYHKKERKRERELCSELDVGVVLDDSYWFDFDWQLESYEWHLLLYKFGWHCWIAIVTEFGYLSSLSSLIFIVVNHRSIIVAIIITDPHMFIMKDTKRQTWNSAKPRGEVCGKRVISG